MLELQSVQLHRCKVDKLWVCIAYSAKEAVQDQKPKTLHRNSFDDRRCYRRVRIPNKGKITGPVAPY